MFFLEMSGKKDLNKDLIEDEIACVIAEVFSGNHADLDLFKHINGAKYAVLVDGDNDVIKQKEKDKNKQRCDSDGAIFCKLSKKRLKIIVVLKIKECYVAEIKSKNRRG